MAVATLLNMPLPVMQLVGISVFTACAIIAAGLLFLERPMEEYSYQPPQKEKQKKYNDLDLFEMVSMGFEYSDSVEALEKCKSVERAVDYLLSVSVSKEPKAEQSKLAEPSNQLDQVNKQVPKEWISFEKSSLQQRLSLLEEFETKQQLLENVDDQIEMQKQYREKMRKDVEQIKLLLEHGLEDSVGSTTDHELVGESMMESKESFIEQGLEQEVVREPSVSMLDIPITPTVVLNQSIAAVSIADSDHVSTIESESAPLNPIDLESNTLKTIDLNPIDLEAKSSSSEWDMASV